MDPQSFRYQGIKQLGTVAPNFKDALADDNI